MSLTLEYPDKYRLWSDLIQGNADRVFVATEEPPALGARVPVKLALPGLLLSMVIEGTVIGRRTRSARFAAGVYLRFSDEQIEKCRKFLGLTQAPERYVQGRKAPRVRCDLEVALHEPKTEALARAKNLSDTGILMTSPVELLVGQNVEGVLTLDEGEPLPFVSEVSWARNDKRLVGLRFVGLDKEQIDLVRRAMDRLELAAASSGRRPILVADDEPNILDFLGKALSNHGYEVRKARRGEEALDLVRELKPALVLLDILMPGIDGVDICKMMRADIEMADIPVIFLSALDSERLHQVADEAGATDYLAKPVNLADLINMVGLYLRA